MNKKQPVIIRQPIETASAAVRKAPRNRRKTRYELYEQIGQGGAGTVFRAHDRELNRTVAVKVLHPELIPDLGNLLRLKREVVLAARVQSPYVVRVHELGEHGGRPLIAMEYIEGESMDRVLSRTGRLPPGQVLTLATGICRGLRDIHAVSLVHRDLKPANVLIDKSGNIHLSDFGVACSTLPGDWNLTRPGGSCGTPTYAAPEQLAGLRSDSRSDLYSFGLLLLTMLTGTTALETLHAVRDILTKSEGDKRVIISDLQSMATLENVIRACLHVSREARISSADEVLSLLSALPAQPHSSTPAIGEIYGSVKLVIRNNKVAVVLAAALVAAFTWICTRAVPAARPIGHSLAVGTTQPLYTDALNIIDSKGTDEEMQQSVKALGDSVGRQPQNLFAQNAYLDAIIRLYELNHDGRWLSQGRRALRDAGAAGMAELEYLMFEARLDLNSGDDSRVIEKLSARHALLDSSESANLLLGRAYEDLSDNERALSCYHAALRINPESWKACNALGTVLVEQDHLNDAVRQFSRVIQLNPSDTVGYSNLGTAFLRLGRVHEARTSFEQALQKGVSAEAYNNLGVAAYYQHEYATSIPFFEAALRVRPNADKYFAGLADAQRHSDRPALARLAYGQALKLLDTLSATRPLRPEEQARRVRCLAWLGDRAGAATVLQAAVAQFPTSGSILYTAAILETSDGRRKAAAGWLDRAVRYGYPSALLKQDPDLRDVDGVNGVNHLSPGARLPDF